MLGKHLCLPTPNGSKSRLVVDPFLGWSKCDALGSNRKDELKEGVDPIPLQIEWRPLISLTAGKLYYVY